MSMETNLLYTLILLIYLVPLLAANCSRLPNFVLTDADGDMNILVTNDDGVTAPGLLALAQAMQPLGSIKILAPDRNWSGSGHVKTLDRPLRVKK